MTYYDHEYSRPIDVKGGIKAASRRGDFGSNWWAKRWTQTLEQFSIGARFSRGRSYARRGQVLSIDIRNGVVEAKVQGSRKRPYDVEISVRTIDAGDWERLREALAEQPVIAASLLAGRMPENIEGTFPRSLHLSGSPRRSHHHHRHPRRASRLGPATPPRHYHLPLMTISRQPVLGLPS